jgi:hypothetical protein
MTLDSCLNLIYSFWSSKPKRAKSYSSIFYAIIGEFDNQVNFWPKLIAAPSRTTRHLATETIAKVLYA